MKDDKMQLYQAVLKRKHVGNAHYQQGLKTHKVSDETTAFNYVLFFFCA